MFALVHVLAWRSAATAHGLKFLTIPWPTALAALLLSIVPSFPLAHLFELGRDTVRPPAR